MLIEISTKRLKNKSQNRQVEAEKYKRINSSAKVLEMLRSINSLTMNKADSGERIQLADREGWEHRQGKVDKKSR